MLTIAGVLAILWAVMGADTVLQRILWAVTGVVLMEAGIWRITQSIFEDLQSEWFVQRDDSAPPKNPSWQMAADDGWAAAARLAEPTTAGTTTAGLPRRRPQAMAVPGAVGGPVGAEGPPPSTTHRSPQEVRGRLSSYRDGVRRGRHAERPRED